LSSSLLLPGVQQGELLTVLVLVEQKQLSVQELAPV
jgi:hypothetical protein